MYVTLVRIYSIQYIIMWCLALMENQWWDKPTTTETIQKQFPNWHMEGLCDWFWLLLDFNTVHCELIDSQTSSCGLSTNCQMSPCRFFLSPSHLLFCHLSSALVLSPMWGELIHWIRLDTLDKWADDFPQMHPLCNRSRQDVMQCIHIPPLQSNPHSLEYK